MPMQEGSPGSRSTGSRATTGGGAAHQGKTVKPFAYLGEADFVILEGLLEKHVGACLAG
jgi:hypothetical protein